MSSLRSKAAGLARLVAGLGRRLRQPSSLGHATLRGVRKYLAIHRHDLCAAILIKLIRRNTDSKKGILAKAFNLTLREAEVLYWLTLGKTNRDISAILGLSARTVNKHLEQIFQKMRIDNRTSAAVMADRALHAQ
jgi:DNA-binding CsgD family transcriptional regulator